MEDPDWAKIISYLYESETGRVQAPIYERGETSGITGSHPFVEELDLTRKEAADALFQANEFGFLELTHQSEGVIESEDLVFDMFKPKYPKRDSDLHEYALRLSKRGFDVAHEREMKQNQSRINVSIAILTTFLVMGSTLQGVSAFLAQDEFVNQIVLIGIMLVVLSLAVILFPFMAGQNRIDFLKGIGHSVDPRRFF
jgi:hypothetical protein